MFLSYLLALNASILILTLSSVVLRFQFELEMQLIELPPFQKALE